MPDLFDPRPVKPDPRGHRLPADWQPSPEARRFAEGLGLDPDQLAASFRDYWCDVPGQRGRKIDWLGTWRNWCRRTAQDRTLLKPSVRSNMALQEPSENEWERRLRGYRPGKFWSTTWGQKPEYGNPLIPRAIYERWKASLATEPTHG